MLVMIVSGTASSPLTMNAAEITASTTVGYWRRQARGNAIAASRSTEVTGPAGSGYISAARCRAIASMLPANSAPAPSASARRWERVGAGRFHAVVAAWLPSGPAGTEVCADAAAPSAVEPSAVEPSAVEPSGVGLAGDWLGAGARIATP